MTKVYCVFKEVYDWDYRDQESQESFLLKIFATKEAAETYVKSYSDDSGDKYELSLEEMDLE